MTFRAMEEYEIAKETWLPAPHRVYIQETGDFINFGDSDIIEFQDPMVSQIMGNKRLGDIRRLQQLSNRFRSTDIENFKEFRYFGCILKLEDNAFNGCQLLEEISLPMYLYLIGNHSFGGCSNLRELILPDSLEIIADSALSGCYSLTKLTLPSNIKSIGSYAFNECRALEEINIKSFLPPYIHDKTIFNGCSSLKSINVWSSLVPKFLNDYRWSAFAGLIKGKEWNV